MGKKSRQKAVNAEKPDNLPAGLVLPDVSTGRKPLPVGWIILFGPLLIVAVVLLFGKMGWLGEQSDEGARTEAIQHNSLGMSALEQGRYEEALKHFGTALKIKADYDEPWHNIGVLYSQTGDYDRAISALQKALSFNPKKKELIYNNLGLVYANKKEWDTAIEYFRTALKLDIRAAPVHRNIARAALSKGDMQLALESYQRAIEARPTMQNLYNEMLLESVHSIEDEKLVEAAQAIIDRGLRESDLERYDAVIVNEFLSRDKRLAEDYMNLGQIYAKLGQSDAALEATLEAVKVDPENPVIRNRLGILYATGGNLDLAEEQFSIAVQLKPDYEDARMNLQQSRRRHNR